jgi:hypothetical protein
MPAKTKLSSAPHLRLVYSAPRPDQSVIRELRRLSMPATKSLPFVRVRAGAAPLDRPESFWNVEPVGSAKADMERGRRYARQALAAMKFDHNSDLIALVVEDMIKDSIERSRRKRRRSAAISGFLAEIGETLATIN